MSICQYQILLYLPLSTSQCHDLSQFRPFNVNIVQFNFTSWCQLHDPNRLECWPLNITSMEDWMMLHYMIQKLRCGSQHRNIKTSAVTGHALYPGYRHNRCEGLTATRQTQHPKGRWPCRVRFPRESGIVKCSGELRDDSLSTTHEICPLFPDCYFWLLHLFVLAIERNPHFLPLCTTFFNWRFVGQMSTLTRCQSVIAKSSLVYFVFLNLY